MSEIIFKKSVKRSKRFAPLIERYVHEQHPVSGVSLFNTIKDLMMFAALLGFKKGKKKSLNDYDDGFDLIAPAEWMNDNNLAVFFALALADSKDTSILKAENEDEMIQIFEEYANFGFSEMEKWMIPTDNTGEVSLLQGLQKEGVFGDQIDEDEGDNLENVVF